MKVTIRDVALHANVSFQLVSAVLGKKSYARASEEVKKRIFSSAEALGYIPNASAGRLRGNASKIIGVMADTHASDDIKLLMACLDQQAGAAGYRILTAQAHDSPDKLLEAYYCLKENGVDGIISLAHDYPEASTQLGKLLNNEERIIFVRNTGNIDSSVVDIDVASGVTYALEHLKSEGYRKTGLLLLAERERHSGSISERIRGFCKTEPEENIFFITQIPEIAGHVSAAENEISRLLQEEFLPGHFDSLIIQNDYLGALVENILLKNNIRIPEDFGLVGCDDLLVAQCLPVKLTSLRYNHTLIAQKTMELLIEHINGKKEKSSFFLQPELAIRESSSKNINSKV
jgi:DNA-binding LacI/PurR family transcriptional regulator